MNCNLIYRLQSLEKLHKLELCKYDDIIITLTTSILEGKELKDIQEMISDTKYTIEEIGNITLPATWKYSARNRIAIVLKEKA